MAIERPAGTRAGAIVGVRACGACAGDRERVRVSVPLGPLVEAVLLRRYKRFLADVRLADGSVVVAHTSNTGRMTGCAEPGASVLLSPAPPGARIPYRWRLVRVGRSWVCIDTLLPNRVVADALRRRAIPSLAMYDRVTTEAPHSDGGRMDVLLSDSTGVHPPCAVEVKNVTLRRGRRALFPDAPSERGRRHLEQLARHVARGGRAVLLPFVARGDCLSFAAADDVDPAWADALEAAASAGVEVLPWQARVGRRSVALARPLPWIRRAQAAAGSGAP